MIAENNNQHPHISNSDIRHKWFFNFQDRQSIISDYISRKGNNPTEEQIEEMEAQVESCVRLYNKTKEMNHRELFVFIFDEFINPSNLGWYSDDFDELNAEQIRDIATYKGYLCSAILSYRDLFNDC